MLFEFMQSSYSLGKIQNLKEFRRPRTFWQENVVFHRRKISYFNFTYIFCIFLLVLTHFMALVSFYTP